ncbi:MAG: site-specific integrase [Burkholderiaceae bacterium]
MYRAPLSGRHTCGTRALDRGVSIETVQRQLGHSDARTTMRYTKPQLDRVQAEMEKGFG